MSTVYRLKKGKGTYGKEGSSIGIEDLLLVKKDYDTNVVNLEEKSHFHTNEDVLKTISQDDVDNWNNSIVKEGFGKVLEYSKTFDAADLDFDYYGYESLIPMQEGKMIMIHGYCISWDITSPLESNYVDLVLGYDIVAYGYNHSVVEIPINQTGRGVKYETSHGYELNYFGNDDESIINAPIVLKWSDYVGFSEFKGKIDVKILYAYVDYPFDYNLYSS